MCCYFRKFLMKRKQTLKTMRQTNYADVSLLEISKCRLYWYNLHDASTLTIHSIFHIIVCANVHLLHSLYSQWLPSRKFKSYWLACIHYWVFCNLQTSISGSLCATVKWQAPCNFRSPILLTMTRTLVYRVHFPYKIYNLFASKTICFNHMQITLLAFHGMTTGADTVYI